MLRLLKRSKQAPVDDEPATEPEHTSQPTGTDRLFALIPEGGFSFRLFTFPALEPAWSYLHSQALLLRQEKIVGFWALDSESVSERYAATGPPTEAVVLIRAANRPDTVQLYSFVDMAAACSFVRDLAEGGLDLSRVLLYWASLVSLNESPPAQTKVTQAGSEGWKLAADRREPIPSPGEPTRAASRGPDNGVNPAREEAGPKETTTATPLEGARPTLEMRGERSSLLAQVRDWPGWDGLAARMVAASLLNQKVYQDLRRDRHATGRAALVIGLIVLAAGLGAAETGLASMLWHSAAALAGWAIFATAAYLIGTWVLAGRQVAPVQFFEALALASSPGLLFVLGSVPVYGPLFALGASLWIAAATAMALPPLLGLDREPALLTAFVAWLPFFALAQVAPSVLA